MTDPTMGSGPLASYYPMWGHVDMRFSERFALTTGFLVNNADEYVGTFFVVQEDFSGWMGEPIRPTARFMVTTRHTILEHPNLRAIMRRADGTISDPWVVTDWEYPNDQRTDIALRTFDRDDWYDFHALPVGFDVDATGREVALGSLAYLVGLTYSTPLAKTGQPVVKGGTVARLGLKGIKWKVEGKSEGWTANMVHLMDVRGRTGYSGGPCFVQWLIPDAKKDEWPDIWNQSAKFNDNDPETMGTLRTFTHWWGMFGGFVDDYGIGAVIPTSEIRSFLGSDKVKAMKDEQEKKWNDEDDAMTAATKRP